MKILILLVLVGLVCSEPSQPSPKASSKEEFTVYLTPWESKVVEVKKSIDTEAKETTSDGPEKENRNPSEAKPTTTTTTTSAPIIVNNVPIDLTQRLFFANHLDSQFRRKTLDLSGLNLSGEDVMKILHSFNATMLERITRLDLSRNRVRSLPPRVWPLELEYSLRELRLDHNSLDTTDPDSRKATSFELLRLLSLQKLSLSHNGLATMVSVPEMEYPHSLEWLDLSGNRMFDLPNRLDALPKLKHLDISGNRIRYLGKYPLSSLDQLQTLNLSSNGIERIWGDPMEELLYLETLHLENNSLSDIPKLHHFTGSYQPHMEVYLGGNPFKCRCDFENVMDIGRVQIMDDSNVTCVDDKGVVMRWNEAPPGTCSHPWVQVREKWSGVKEWVQDHRPDWSTLYRSLGWVLFGITLGVVYAHRRSKKTPPAASQLPYNILDDRAAY